MVKSSNSSFHSYSCTALATSSLFVAQRKSESERKREIRERKALFGEAFGSFCFSKKLQKLKAPPNGVCCSQKQKLRKLILHWESKSSSGPASRASTGEPLFSSFPVSSPPSVSAVACHRPYALASAVAAPAASSLACRRRRVLSRLPPSPATIAAPRLLSSPRPPRPPSPAGRAPLRTRVGLGAGGGELP